MSHPFYRGKMTVWKDDRGFGFIESENGKKEIFIHISALKGMSRRPAVGDMIKYRIHTDNDGKSRAVDATIEGVAKIRQRNNRKKNINRRSNGCLSLFLIIALLGLAAFAYNIIIKTKTIPTPNISREQEEQLARAEETAYNCNGKVYCSEMTSCEEAKFYLKNCPGTKMDGDGDGIPCESQWCGNDSW